MTVRDKRPPKWARFNSFSESKDSGDVGHGSLRYKCEYRVNYKMRVIEGEGLMSMVKRHAVFTCTSECWSFKDSLIKSPRVEFEGTTYMVVGGSIECFGPDGVQLKDTRKKRDRSKGADKKPFGFPRKECNKCGKERSLSSFYKDKDEEDGKDITCIKCHTAERMNKGLGR